MECLNILSSSEINELLGTIHSLVLIKEKEQFKSVAKSIKELLECDHIIFGLPKSNSDNAMAVDDLNINYPREWVHIYQNNEFWRIDPVVLAVMENAGPQHWSDIYARYPPQKKFLALASDFGINDGLTCRTQGGIGLPWTIVSTVGNYKSNRRHKNRARCILDTLSPHIHIALSILKEIIRTKKLENLLTKREREVLKWLSQGKTSWETSVILSISEATVNFHVKNINTKLHTSGRSHAVAVAMQHGLQL